MATLTRNLKYRAYPTAEQEALLRGWMGTLRWLWNRFLEQWRMVLGRTAYDRSRSSFVYPSAIAQSKEMTELQELSEFEWIQDTQCQARQQIIHDLETAWKLCFKKLARAPHMKRPGEPVRIYIPSSAVRFELGARGKVRQLTFSGSSAYRKLGALKVIIDRPLQGKVKSWSITREGNEWYAIACCEVEKELPPPVNNLSVGIDRGVINLLADSEGRLVPNPKPQAKIEQRIHRLERKAAKQKKGSKNQRKTYDRINKLRRTAIRTMENLIDTETLFYAENYGTVVIEKLQLTNMTASAKGTKEKPGKKVRQKSGLNKAILQASPGKIGERLRYKVEERGGTLLEVPAAHTSDTCRMCGHSDPLNRQTQDIFLCVKCRHQEHADTHAAKNILSKGLAGNVVVRKKPKKVSRLRRKAKPKNAEVKPTLKQPVEVLGCKETAEAGTQSRKGLDRDPSDGSRQCSTFNSENTS